MKSLHTATLVVGLALGPGCAFGGEPADDDHRGAVLEIGLAREYGLGEDKVGFGPSVALEVTPIEHWLEIEAGITQLRSRDGTEWEERMVGVGPQWVAPNRTFGAVAVLDFMFWTTPQYGWFVEPSYSYAFNRGHDQSLAVNVGLLIALPPP